MNSLNLFADTALRNFIADHSDYYALKDSIDANRGLAQKFAEEIAGTKVEKSNIRGLESLAWSTESVADILDYIRLRTGRDKKQESWNCNKVGQKLADTLERLKKETEAFFTEHSIKADESQKRLLHLNLCREFIKHLTAHYEFEKAKRGEKDE